jgi:hypothetical protein
MKFILTESKLKNIFFKYWDKTGKWKVDKTFISLFGLDSGNPMVTYDQAYKYLVEFRGNDQAKELAKSLLLQNPHHIDDYGNYDFFFEVVDIDNWDLDDDEPFVVVRIKVDDMSGSVNLGDGERTLEDALNDDIFGWEINDEVDWGVNDYFKDNITTNTGIKVIYGTPEYTSKTEFNYGG